MAEAPVYVAEAPAYVAEAPVYVAEAPPIRESFNLSYCQAQPKFQPQLS